MELSFVPEVGGAVQKKSLGDVCINRTGAALIARLRQHRWKALGLGAAVSAVLLYLALRDIDWSALGNTLANVRLGDIGLCGLMIALGIVLRGARWCLIAGKPLHTVGVFARSTNLGLLGNQLLPGKLGEAVRIAALVRLLPASASESLSSAVLDRVMDACVLLLSAWAVSVAVAAGVVPNRWVAGLGALLACLAMAFALMHTQAFHSRFVAWSERWLHRWKLQPAAFLIVFNATVRRMLRPRALVLVLIATSAVWLVDYLTIAAAIWSIGLDLPVMAPLLLWVALAVGTSLPSTPGYVGVYQIAAVWGLSVYNVPAHQAVAIAFVLQLVLLFVTLAGGGHEASRLLRTRQKVNINHSE
jgi:uncharacterized protein (TIRG00374 family)